MAGDRDEMAFAGLADRRIARRQCDRIAARCVDVGQLGLHVLVDEQQRLGHRHLDPLAQARPVPLVQCGEDGRQREEPGVHVGVGVRLVGRLAAAMGDAAGRHPHLGLRDHRVRPPAGPRTVLAVAGQATRRSAAGCPPAASLRRDRAGP